MEILSVKAREELIIPFCNENNYSFYSGNGEFYFFRLNSQKSLEEDDLPKELTDTLNEEMLNEEAFGSYIESYDPSKTQTDP